MKIPKFKLSVIIFLFSLIECSLSLGEDMQFVYCKNQKQVRTLRIEKGEGLGGCKAVYNKLGSDKIIGVSRFKDMCGSYLENVKKKLEYGSWRCRSVSKSDVSDLNSDSVTGSGTVQ